MERKDLLATDPGLAKIVRLLQSYEPERIILFGSRARGEADPQSDYDLIVIKHTERPFLDRLQEMVPYLVQFDHAAEILVYTPEEFEHLGETGLGWVVQKGGGAGSTPPPVFTASKRLKRRSRPSFTARGTGWWWDIQCGNWPGSASPTIRLSLG